MPHGQGSPLLPLAPEWQLHKQGLVETALLGHAAEHHNLTVAVGAVPASHPARVEGAAGHPTGAAGGVLEVGHPTAVCHELAFGPPAQQGFCISLTQDTATSDNSLE